MPRVGDTIPTIKVVRAGSRLGYHIINQCDFDASRHVPYEDAPTPDHADVVVEPTAKAGKITHTMSKNRWWKVYRDMELIGKGRGLKTLADFLEGV